MNGDAVFSVVSLAVSLFLLLERLTDDDPYKQSLKGKVDYLDKTVEGLKQKEMYRSYCEKSKE